MNRTWRVIIADDHAVTRTGIRLMAESIEGVTVVAEAGTGVEAIALCRVHEPDVVLMDLSMPEMGGIEAIRVLRREYPDLVMLVLTVDDSEEQIVRAIEAGASGYLSKASKLEEIRTIFAGLGSAGEALFMTPAIAGKLVHSIVERRSMRRTSGSTMTPRETEILELLGTGMSARQIGRRLDIRERTVNTHVGNIYRKLGANNRVDAIREAMRRQLIDVTG